MSKKITRISTEFIIRYWDIEGFSSYFFGEDKKLYRFDSRGQIKQNKRIVIGTTQGYILKRKFYSLAQLRPLLRRHNPTDNPVDF
ncbi:hypothetical protein GCM10028807_47630 [Spirosoma daeguense]